MVEHLGVFQAVKTLRRLALVLALVGSAQLCVAPPAEATITLLGHLSSDFSNGTNGGTTAGLDTSSADLIVVGISFLTGHEPTVSDSKTLTWTGLTAQNAFGEVGVRIFYTWNVTTGGAGHTFTLTGSGSFSTITVAAWSGSQTASDPFDQQSGAVGSGTTLQPTSVTPGVDNEVVVNVHSTYTTSAVSIDVTTILEQLTASADYSAALASEIQTTATARDPTWTQSGSYRTAVAQATFKAAAGGGGGLVCTPTISTLGVGRCG